MQPSTALFVTFAAVAMAMPASNNVQARAGGPEAKPIPTSCRVTYPIPMLDPSQGYLPAPSTNDALFYGAYYPSPSKDKDALSKQCLSQCYGYGDNTECKAAYWAENVEVPEGYRGSGTYNTACLFYNRTLTEEDLVNAPEGKGTTPFVANLEC